MANSRRFVRGPWAEGPARADAPAADPATRDGHDLPAPGAWAALAALSADLMALLDEAGRIVWVNAAFERTSGRPAADVRGRPLAELLAVAGDSSPWPAVA